MMFFKTIAFVGLSAILWSSQANTLQNEIVQTNKQINIETTNQDHWTYHNDCGQYHDPENCINFGQRMQNTTGYNTRHNSRQRNGNCHRTGK